jgi:hypothetical protein
MILSQLLVDFRKKLKELKSELPSASIMSKFEAVVKTYIIEDDNKKLTEDHFSVRFQIKESINVYGKASHTCFCNW